MDPGEEVLFEQMQDASDKAGKLFIEVVRQKNIKSLNDLVNRRYPEALWGKYFKSLSPQDQEWVNANLEE